MNFCDHISFPCKIMNFYPILMPVSLFFSNFFIFFISWKIIFVLCLLSTKKYKTFRNLRIYLFSKFRPEVMSSTTPRVTKKCDFLIKKIKISIQKYIFLKRPILGLSNGGSIISLRHLQPEIYWLNLAWKFCTIE